MLRRTALILFAAVLAGGALLLLLDLVQLHRSPGDYEQVYGFSGLEERWGHRSVFNYGLSSLGLVCFLLVGAVLALSQLEPRGLASRRAFHVYLVVLAALIAHGFFVGWSSGFDH